MTNKVPEKSTHRQIAETQKSLDKLRTPAKKREPDGYVKLESHPANPDENNQSVGRETIERSDPDTASSDFDGGQGPVD